jgi:hypothetical protein
LTVKLDTSRIPTNANIKSFCAVFVGLLHAKEVAAPLSAAAVLTRIVSLPALGEADGDALGLTDGLADALAEGETDGLADADALGLALPTAGIKAHCHIT